MHKALICSLTGLFVALSTAAADKADDIKSWRSCSSMTGPVATIGEQQKRGGEAAAAAINAAGGHGAQYQDHSQGRQQPAIPKQAVRPVAESLWCRRSIRRPGHFCSEVSIPASDVYADNNVLMMSPASSNPALTGKGHPTVIRLYGRDDAQGGFMAPWIAREIQGQDDRDPHDSPTRQRFSPPWSRTTERSGVKEVDFEGIDSGEKDYGAIVTKLKNLQAPERLTSAVVTEAGERGAVGRPGLQAQSDRDGPLRRPPNSGPSPRQRRNVSPSRPIRAVPPMAAKALERFKNTQELRTRRLRPTTGIGAIARE